MTPKTVKDVRPLTALLAGVCAVSTGASKERKPTDEEAELETVRPDLTLAVPVLAALHTT